jgi:hypothetical protein
MRPEVLLVPQHSRVGVVCQLNQGISFNLCGSASRFSLPPVVGVLLPGSAVCGSSVFRVCVVTSWSRNFDISA